MTFARVITPTSTFYPPKSQQQDDQIINGILNFIKSSMDCKLQYFQTNKRTFVFSTWNHIRFIISGIQESVSYLRFRLQMIREIAVFLFGPDFDQIMRNNSININYIDLFAKYVDTFLEISEDDYKFQLGIISHDSLFSEYSHYLSKNIPTSQFPHDLPFIDCIIFRNYQIVSRFNLSNPNPIDYLSIFILSIFMRIEYPKINSSAIKSNIRKTIPKKDTQIQKDIEKNDESNASRDDSKDNDNHDNQEKTTNNQSKKAGNSTNNSDDNAESIRSLYYSTLSRINNDVNDNDNDEDRIRYFDPNYVNITEPPSVQLRAGYFNINGTSQPISISATRLGPYSPYVALFLTQELNANVKRFIVAGIISLISSTMSEALRLSLSPLSLTSPGLVYYLATNRNSGETFEFETSNDAKSHNITNLLIRTMKNHVFDALYNVQTTYIWRDTHFLFVYSIFFIQNDGKSITPSEKFKIPLFKSNFNLNYNSICNEVFHKDKNIRVFEVYSIFLTAIPPQIAYSETIKMLVDILKEKRISFAGNIDYFQTSIMPSSKKSRAAVANS